MALKRFPIGVQDFAVVREDGKYYVDKTDLIYKLAHAGRYYFLSRPRRFGKSLLVSTLQYYFEGRKDLFTGLAMEKLESEWKKYPVIRLDMSIVKYSGKDSLANSLNKILEPQEKRFLGESAWHEACEALARKYDGYHFSKNSPDIFNPFSLINALSKRELSNYWFATGTPTILTRLVKRSTTWMRSSLTRALP